MMTINKILFATLASAASLSLNAQNLKTEITVDRTVVPVEREAVRPGSLMPQMISPDVKKRELTAADYTTAVGLTRSASVLEPAAYGDTLALSPFRGYASLGYFPVYNLGASAGYRLVDKQNTRLGAWMQFDGCSYGSSDKDIKGKYKNNAATVGLRFDQRIGLRTSFSAAADYTYSAIGLPDDFIETKQSANDFNLKLALWSRSNALAYHVNAAFSHFGYGKDLSTLNFVDGAASEPVDYKAASENRFVFKGGVAYLGSTAAPRAGIELSLDFLSRSNGVETTYQEDYMGVLTPSFDHTGDGTLGVVSLTPYYVLNSGSFHGRLGVKIDLSTGGEGKKFHIAPAVMLDWNASSQVALYALLEGGEHLNTLSSLHSYCPYIYGMWHYQRSHIPVNAELGVNIGPISGFSAKLFGAFAKANDWLMPQYIETYGAGSRCFIGSNYGYYDLKSWHAGLKLEYQWRSMVTVKATAEIAPNDIDKSYYMWRDRAKFVFGASVDVKPIEALTIGAGYELRADRRNYAFDFHGDCEAIDLKDMSNLSLGAWYSINEQFSVFAKGENLLNKRSYIATDIEAQGIKGLLGVNYKF